MHDAGYEEDEDEEAGDNGNNDVSGVVVKSEHAVLPGRQLARLRPGWRDLARTIAVTFPARFGNKSPPSRGNPKPAAVQLLVEKWDDLLLHVQNC